MTQQLHDLLHELGNEQDPVHIDPGTFERGRRAHRRGVAVVSGLALLAIVAGVGGVLGLRSSTQSTDPIGDPGKPALPTTVFDVPERLVSFHEDGYSWDPWIAAGSLAIGPTALVFPVHNGAVAAVSALDGRYRGLDLPGFDDGAYFRFDGEVTALSPDGTKLAYTWNDSVIGSEPVKQSGIRIADLETGAVQDIPMRSEFGVFAQGIAWSPNQHYLAYNLWTSTNARGEVHGSQNFTVERLDLRTGERLEADLPSGDTTVAVSNRGEVARTVSLGARTWLPGRSPETREVPGLRNASSVVWSPEGLLATGASDSNRPYVVWAGPTDEMSARVVPRSTERQSSMLAVGWAGDDVVVRRSTTDRTVELTGIGPQGASRALVSGPGLPHPTDHLSVATDLLGQPTRDYPEPDWPTDWTKVGVAVAGAVVVLALLALMAAGWRRNRLS